MTRRSEVAVMAVASLLAGVGVSMADGTPSKSTYLTLTPSVLTMDDAAPRAPLMSLFDKAGVGKTLDDAGINIYGYVEAGYTYSFDYHSGITPPYVGRIFDAESPNIIDLNQTALTFERVVDSKKLDIGGRVDLIYGTDARYIHSDGLNLYSQANAVVNNNPILQFDPAQAYIDVNIPVGNGLKIRAGKMITPIGYEYTNPTLNAFYSHSFLFNYADSISLTGVFAYYSINDQISVSGGVDRGNEQTLKDNNTAISGFAGITYTPTKEWTLVATAQAGPENTGDNGHITTLLDTQAIYTPNSTWTFGYNGTVGVNPAGDATGGEDTWFGVALYAGYSINDYVTANGRIEGFYDGDGARTGYNLLGGFDNDITLAETTAGLTIKPFPKDQYGSGLKLRPEVRYDYADRKFTFGNGRNDQITVAMDVIYAF